MEPVPSSTAFPGASAYRTHAPPIAEVVRLATAAGIYMRGVATGTPVADGAYAALVMERAAACLSQAPRPNRAAEEALILARHVAFLYLTEAGALK